MSVVYIMLVGSNGNLDNKVKRTIIPYLRHNIIIAGLIYVRILGFK
jgi:hypothetical protein